MLATSPAGRSFQTMFRSLRSTAAIEPTTMAMAITWTVSIAGNAQADWAMACAGPLASIHLATVSIDMPGFP